MTLRQDLEKLLADEQLTEPIVQKMQRIAAGSSEELSLQETFTALSISIKAHREAMLRLADEVDALRSSER